MSTPSPTLDRIADAVVRLAVERGMGSLGMIDVAGLAKVSAGTLYNHFENKDAMLRQVYLRKKHALHTDLMAGLSDGPPRARIEGMWQRLMQVATERPRDILFLEFVGAAQILTPEEQAEVAVLQQEVEAPIRTALTDGTFAPVSTAVAVALLIAPALHLARLAALQGDAPNKDDANETFTRIWAALSPDAGS